MLDKWIDLFIRGPFFVKKHVPDSMMAEISNNKHLLFLLMFQASGLHVVLETPSVNCSCPATNLQQNSGMWQVSGTTGGKQLDKVSIYLPSTYVKLPVYPFVYVILA